MSGHIDQAKDQLDKAWAKAEDTQTGSFGTQVGRVLGHGLAAINCLIAAVERLERRVDRMEERVEK